MTWIDRCLGAGAAVSWSGDMLTAATAASALVLDGIDPAPVVEVHAYSPAGQAEVDCAIAVAALHASRDAALIDRVLDRAFASAE